MQAPQRRAIAIAAAAGLLAVLASAGGAEGSIPRPEAAELAAWPPALLDAPTLVDLELASAPPATTTAPPETSAAGHRFGLFDPGPGAGLFAAGRPSARARLEAETRLRVHDFELAVRVELAPLEVAERTGFTVFGRPGMRRESENRWYDPELGRFTTTDPLGYVDGPNLYGYAGNNPVNFSDPLGLCLGLNNLPCWATLASAAGWGVGVAESGLHLAAAPVTMTVQSTREAWQHSRRIVSGYQRGGLAEAIAEGERSSQEQAEVNKQRLLGMIPGVNTVRQGSQIVEVCEQQGSFACGRQIGRTTFSAGTDATIVYGAGRGLRNATDLSQTFDDALRGAAQDLARESRVPAPSTPRGPVPPASVDELVTMMNNRPGTIAEFATGDAERYLRAVNAEGSHTLLEGGRSHILLRQDVATRRTAFHEWLHRRLQRETGGPRPGEDALVESFLERHKELLRLED